MALQPGATLGPYEILSLIGAGGMGEVYLAREQGLGRRVALKVLPAEFSHDPRRVGRFEQEARSASALSHPNICTIFALGELPDGRRFIAMEYIEGHTLRHRLGTDRMSLRNALDISSQVAAGVSAAHAAGIIHRDLKPENVVIRPDGLVKVVDFGLAKLALSTDSGTTHLGAKTDPGSAVGTIAYMSPEQARAQDVDARTDIWSLGVLLYEMVAGRTPFAGGSTSDVLAGILDREPAPLTRFDPTVPAELQRLVGKTLRKDREQRYQGMKDLLLDLRALRDDATGQANSGGANDRNADGVTPATPIVAAATTVAPRLQSSAEYVVTGLARHKGVTALGAGILAVLIAGGTWWAARNRHTGAEGPRSSVPVQRSLTRLTFGPGLQTDVTWSPDGRFIAYASDTTGNFDIWVQPVGGGNPVQVTTSDAHDRHPDWSPDGSQLVFRSERDGGGLYVVPALGGVERQLAAFGSNPSWSHAGNEVMFVSGSELGDVTFAARLHAVAVDGGTPRELLADFLKGGYWAWIAPHPDGRISLLGYHREFGGGFFTMARDGTGLIRSKETSGLPFAAYTQEELVRQRFRWHPSGRTLFVQTAVNGVHNLWKVRIEATTLKWVDAERLTTGAGTDVSPSLAPDGTRLAFTTEQGAWRLWLFPFDQATHRLGPGKPITDENTTATSCRFSQDGRFLTYRLHRAGIELSELWIADIDAGSRELVGANIDNLVWSPDGKSMAYNYWPTGPNASRVAIRELGGRERFASRRESQVWPWDWHQKHGLLAIYREGKSLVLWPLANPDADAPQRALISEPDAYFWQPRFSPNGRWLSFGRAAFGNVGGLEVYVAPAEGSTADRWTRVAADHALPDKPRWSADGRQIYILSKRHGSYFNLWAVPFDPDRGVPLGSGVPLTSFDSPNMAISSDVSHSEMDVSAQHVVLTMKTVSGNIWMLDNVDR